MVWKFVSKNITSIKKRLVKIYNFSRKKYVLLIQKIKPWCKIWIDKIKKIWQKNKFSDKIISRLKAILKWLKVITFKHKKWIILLVFVVGYILFWMWFFGERNVAVDERKDVDSQEVVVEVKNDKGSDNQKKEKKKEFTEADLGTFWLEVNTEKVKIKAPIVNGIQDSDLDRGLGRHKTMAMLGEKGNLVISGHRWKFGNNPARTAFIDLDKLKKVTK